MTSNNYTNEWIAFGDVNPIEHGGTWVRKEEGNETTFEMVSITTDYEGNIKIEWFSVDTTDSWINWEAVNNYCDFSCILDSDFLEYRKAIGVVDYYGTNEFSPSVDYFSADEVNLEEKVIKALSAWGITIGGEH